ncbi:MAG: hypothetical protein ACTSVI_05245 [Promethearchaeota archaeon]
MEGIWLGNDDDNCEPIGLIFSGLNAGDKIEVDITSDDNAGSVTEKVESVISSIRGIIINRDDNKITKSLITEDIRKIQLPIIPVIQVTARLLLPSKGKEGNLSIPR